MYKRWQDVAFIFTAVFLVPFIILLISSANSDYNNKELATTTESNMTESTQNPSEDISSNRMITVLSREGQILQMPLNSYVAGVVLAEMPADFDSDALKAQAVVARTYALKRESNNQKHPGVVCADASCCQGYISANDYLSNNGTLENLRKIEEAVQDTKELVLVYNGELIEATYFSCSGGMTEDAVAVWGEDIPYLKAQKSPGEENATHYTDTVRFAVDDFKRLLCVETKEAPHTWIGNITRTKGGGIDTMTIAGKTYSGIELRQLLGLRSTAFTVTIIGSTVVVTTKGYGHRVGMSQYGAEAMAVQGSTFDQILKYYYSGTELMMYGE